MSKTVFYVLVIMVVPFQLARFVFGVVSTFYDFSINVFDLLVNKKVNVFDLIFHQYS